MVLVGILNDMGKGSTGVVVPLMAIARQRPTVPFPVCFGIFFALFQRGWHFVTDFSICLSDGKGIGWGDFDSAWGLLCKMFLPVTHYAKLRIKLRIFAFRR